MWEWKGGAVPTLRTEFEKGKGNCKNNMKSFWPMIIAAAVITVVLFYLSSIGKKAPFIPHDNIHSTITTQAGCIACHSTGNQAPLKANHPPKEQCLICHKVNKS